LTIDAVASLKRSDAAVTAMGSASLRTPLDLIAL
jgi:hypothetical protein